jgi:murein DD-endopeptidase MepM/ murein hydrolase activator NlpD
MGYLLPFDKSIRRSQDYGANPGVGPNPPGGHNGDDWATNIGTPVRAAGDGEVTFAGQFDDTYADNFGWNLNYGGNMIVLNMDGDTAPYFEYGHLSTIYVTAGQRVKRGDIIALTGNSDGGTGVSSGPHCHVGCLPANFNLNTSTYGRVNPRIYMTDYWDGSAVNVQSAPVTVAPAAPERTSDEQFFVELSIPLP